jgi:Mg-chelatase subunit ChlD
MNILKIVGLAGLLLLAPQLCAEDLQSAGYSVQITQIDTSDFPDVRLFVSVTDPSGRPISADHRVRLAVYQDDRALSSKTLSDGWGVSAVLAIDRSGSMSKSLDAARQAATAYVERAPAFYQIAVLAFASSPETVQGFTRDKALLRNRIQAIQADGNTALQDTVGLALDLLARRGGRKSLVLLTDGQENASSIHTGEAGHAELLRRCAAEEVSVSVIGLGNEIEEGYLKTFTARGTYLPASQASELRTAFLGEAERLASEQLLEFHSPSPYADGLRERLEVRLEVDGQSVGSLVDVVAPGVLPHVHGEHAPYLFAAALLLLVPGLATLLGKLVRVFQFRRQYLRRLGPGSTQIGKAEANSRKALRAGDLVVLCPKTGTPHDPRAWRMNHCRCMRESGCSGSLCYHQSLPTWLRQVLDRLLAQPMDETGRRWLCRCQGDKEGF